jgi:hypothetical protein
MKRLLPCLVILLMAPLLGVGCATSTNSSGRQQQPTSPPGQVYSPPP